MVVLAGDIFVGVPHMVCLYARGGGSLGFPSCLAVPCRAPRSLVSRLPESKRLRRLFCVVCGRSTSRATDGRRCDLSTRPTTRGARRCTSTSMIRFLWRHPQGRPPQRTSDQNRHGPPRRHHRWETLFRRQAGCRTRFRISRRRMFPAASCRGWWGRPCDLHGFWCRRL